MDTSIIVSLISVTSSFILVYLSCIKDFFRNKKSVQKERLEKFYIPFYKKYRAGFLSINKFSTLDVETRCIFFDLISENIHLLNPEAQAMYEDFYKAFLNMFEIENNDYKYSPDEIRQSMDYIFDKLTISIFKEYKHILKQCHLPVPNI